uniref:Uncharacterized protein n=1 Tax=Parascaris univalens TaxID=6257 RepID=A0A915BSC3_PARUN
MRRLRKNAAFRAERYFDEKGFVIVGCSNEGGYAFEYALSDVCSMFDKAVRVVSELIRSDNAEIGTRLLLSYTHLSLRLLTLSSENVIATSANIPQSIIYQFELIARNMGCEYELPSCEIDVAISCEGTVLRVKLRKSGDELKVKLRVKSTSSILECTVESDVMNAPKKKLWEKTGESDEEHEQWRPVVSADESVVCLIVKWTAVRSSECVTQR